jgi:hypothetical protein
MYCNVLVLPGRRLAMRHSKQIHQHETIMSPRRVHCFYTPMKLYPLELLVVGFPRSERKRLRRVLLVTYLHRKSMHVR